jgi:hypothetical protein
MRFPYIALPTRRPVYPLGGTQVRYRALVAVQVRGPSGARFLSATLDSGSDDTLFPAYIAPRLGIDLAGAPIGEAGGGRGLTDSLPLRAGAATFVQWV